MQFLADFFLTTWDVLLELAPWLLLGVAIAGLLHVVVRKEWIQRKLSGVSGVFRAVLFGVPLPLCSCGVIPTGLGLKKDGASDGATVAFLTSTPQTGVDSVLVSASLLGWPFAIFKVVAALATGLTGGLVTEFTGRSSKPEPLATDDSSACDASAGPAEVQTGFRGKLSAAFEHMVDVLGSIWGWLVFGVVVAALISTVAPASGWSVLQNAGIWPAMLLVLALSTPLYVCATASVPIAAALVAAGMPTGAALVFLMAGPATNVATIGAIYRTLGTRNLVIYLVNIVGASLLLGWLFQGVISPEFATEVMTHHDHGQWWRVVSAIVLLGSFAYFATDTLRRRRRAAQVEASDTVNSVEVDVEGMSCGNCVSKLTRNLEQLEGVAFAVVTLEPGHASVNGAVGEEVVVEAIRASGFKPLIPAAAK